MRPRRSVVIGTIAVVACLSFISSASADDMAAQVPAVNAGPMVIERIHSGFLFAPEVKVTQVDHRTSELVGGYAGWLTDETFFIGGGGYWLADHSRARSMGYAGLEIQWLGRSDQRVGWGIKGLIGAGEATLTDTVTAVTYVPNPALPASSRDDGLPRFVPGPSHTVQLRVRHNFFVAEPEATVVFRASRRVRVSAGVGYRAVSGGWRGDNRLGGPVGTVAVLIGGGS